MTRRSGAWVGNVRVAGDALSKYTFGLRYGVTPVERFWRVTVATAEKVAGLVGTRCGCTVTGPRGERDYRDVWLLAILPADRPETRLLHLSDGRWRWANKHVATRYNMLGTFGQRFLLNSQRVIENAVPVDEVRYLWATTFPRDNPSGTPWDADLVLNDVFEQLGQPWRYGERIGEIKEVQNLELDDPGHRALERVLGLLPSRYVYLDYDGTAIVEDVILSQEKREYIQRVQEAGSNYPLEVDRARMRPVGVVCLFTCELEVRFEYDEDGTLTRTSDDPTLFNVAEMTDIALRIDGRTVGQGSWEILSSLLSAWATADPALIDHRGHPLTLAKLRQHATKYGCTSVEQLWGNTPEHQVNPINLARARSVVEHWRRTFQIAPRFRSRLESIRYTRVGVLNELRALRVPAPVYSDFVRRPTSWSFAKNAAQRADSGWCVTQQEEGPPAPARVVPVDAEAGIFHVAYQTDPYGLSDFILPGTAASGGPWGLLGRANAEQLDLKNQWEAVVLNAGYVMRTILTVTPAFPNDHRRFWPESVVRAPQGNGGLIYVRVPPEMMTAKFAWTFDKEHQLLEFLKGERELPPFDSMINYDQVKEVAQAFGERIYDAYANRILGTGVVDIDNSPEVLTGSLLGVEHAIDSDGRATATLEFAAVPLPDDITHLLPERVRRAVNRVYREGQV